MTFSVISFKAREKEFFCKGGFAIQAVKNSGASLSTIFLLAGRRVFLKQFLPCCLAFTLKSRNIPNHRLKSLKERENKKSKIKTMAKEDFNNRLITPELTEALSSYPLYSQDAKKKDAMCIAVFYLGNIRWYIMEGQQEGNDFTLYGIVTGLQETEYGYQSATEMASITYDASEYGLGTLRIEQDKEFKPCTLAEIEDAELQAFLSKLYDRQ